MAVAIEMTCTDRNGRQLARTVVEGPVFELTAQERSRITREWVHQYTDAGGVTPYIFTRTYSVSG